MFTAGVLNVLPMTASEINAAVVGPAGSGIAWNRSWSPRSSPTPSISQVAPAAAIALAEQFDRTAGSTLSLDDYHALGGVRTALTRRAEQLYESLGADQQQVATQVLLRMVRVGHGVPDMSRRVPISELAQLDVDPVALSNVLEKFILYRLLSVGSGPGHHRSDGRHGPRGAARRVASALRFGRAPPRGSAPIRRTACGGHCVGGLRSKRRLSPQGDTDWTRLGHRILQYLSLSISEREFIEASVARHQADVEAEGVRTRVGVDFDVGLDGDSSALPRHVVVVIVLSGSSASLEWDDPDRRPRVTLFYNDAGEVSDLVEAGFDRAVSDFEFIAQEVDVRGLGDDTLLDDVGHRPAGRHRLDARDRCRLCRPHASRHLVHRPRSVGHRPERHVDCIRRQRGFVPCRCGHGAALLDRCRRLHRWGRYGRHLAVRGRLRRPVPVRLTRTFESLTTYLANPPDYGEGFLAPAAGERAATQMYRASADVIFAAAGTSGLGVFEAAVPPLRTRTPPLGDRGRLGPVRHRRRSPRHGGRRRMGRTHPTASVVKRYDTAVYQALSVYADDGTTESVVLGLAEHGIDLSYSGGFLDSIPRSD